MVAKPKYDAADNGRQSYEEAIGALRMEGVKAGKFLPLADRPEEIAASPIVEDVRVIGGCTLYLGDTLKISPLLVNLDACVTDPPYELGFMGKAWDSTGIAAAWATWCGIRIALKPGAHLVAFAGSRTYHRIAQAIDDGGFEVRDQVMWLYGSGFPKSLDVSKAIDNGLGVERPRLAPQRRAQASTAIAKTGFGADGFAPQSKEAVSDLAKQWNGWGTALKPAHEPVCFARKPLSEDTIVANVLRWMTGAINVDGARVGDDEMAKTASSGKLISSNNSMAGGNYGRIDAGHAVGRWPANVVHDGSREVVSTFPSAPGQQGDLSETGRSRPSQGRFGDMAPPHAHLARKDSGSAARFFYCAKTSRSERELGMTSSPSIAAGVGALRDAGRGAPRANNHPTVKPVELMRWLCRLITPKGGIVLDPFMGSGSTGIACVREGFKFVGIENDRGYFDIACQRIARAVEDAMTAQEEAHAIRVRMHKRILQMIRDGIGVVPWP